MFYNASSEDIEFPSFDSNYIQVKKFKRKEKFSKKCLTIIIILSIFIILIVGIALVIFFSSKQKKESGGIIKLFFSYSKDNQNFKLFEPPNLSQDDYLVDYNGTIPIRMLMDSKLNYKNPEQCSNGTCKINIAFNKPLSSLEGMFANIPELKTVDFSEFNSKKITRMNNLFLNCTNLESVEFGEFEAENLETMDHIFENCSSMTEIDLSSFITPRLSSLNSAFKGCSNLIVLNMKYFILSGVKIDEDVFEGCEKLVVFIKPEKYNELIMEVYNNIKINDNFCKEGIDCERCKSEKIENTEKEIATCDECPLGYLKYNFTKYPIKCKKCEIANCAVCNSEKTCKDCEFHYYFNDTENKCLYDNTIDSTDTTDTSNPSDTTNPNNTTDSSNTTDKTDFIPPFFSSTDISTDENLL